MNEAPPELVEILASIEHERWANWMKHQFSLQRSPLTMTEESFTRWFRQAHTPYLDLDESEKESDRREVRVTLKAISDFLDSKNPALPDNLIFFPGSLPAIGPAENG